MKFGTIPDMSIGLQAKDYTLDFNTLVNSRSHNALNSLPSLTILPSPSFTSLMSLFVTVFYSRKWLDGLALWCQNWPRLQYNTCFVEFSSFSHGILLQIFYLLSLWPFCCLSLETSSLSGSWRPLPSTYLMKVDPVASRKSMGRL